MAGPKAQFQEALDSLRVAYDPATGNVDFAGSALEGSGGGQARDLVKRIAKRLRNDSMDASDVHFTKRLIDQQTAFGTSEGGLAGEIDRAIKGLRRNLNQVLRDNFDDYARANKTYSSAIGALDDFQQAAGSKLDLDDVKALGVKARSFTNNNQARAKLINSLDGIQSVLADNKIRFKDDVLTQVNVANALESRFRELQGTTAFRGEIGRAGRDVITRGTRETVVDRVAQRVDQLLGVSDDNAIESLLNILGD